MAKYNINNLKDIEAERAFLGAILIDADILDVVEDISPEDFYETRHADIFASMLSLHDNMEVVDFVTVSDALRVSGKLEKIGGPRYLAELSSIPPSALSGANYAKIIKRFAYLRRMINFATELAAKSFNVQSPDQLWAWAQEYMMRMTPDAKSGSVLPGWKSTAEYDAILARIKEQAESGEIERWRWPEQWKSWQKHIRPLRPGRVGLLVGASGAGKTSYLTSIAESWAMRGNHVVYVHFEDDHETKLHRRMARWAGIPIDALEDGKMTTEYWRAKAEAEKKIAVWVDRLHYLHAPGWSMAQVVKEIQRLRGEGLCDIAVIDYLDKAQPDRRQLKLFGANIWSRQADDMEKLKILAERARIPILTATQGNKTFSGGGIKTRVNMRGSGERTDKVQLVIIIDREIVDEDTTIAGVDVEKGSLSPIVSVRTDKQNLGASDMFQQFFDGPRFRIIDISYKQIE